MSEAAAAAATTKAVAPPVPAKMPWPCKEKGCKFSADPADPFFEKVVETHLRTHILPGSDSGGKKDRRKDHGDWGAMEKWPADTYPAGSLPILTDLWNLST